MCLCIVCVYLGIVPTVEFTESDHQWNAMHSSLTISRGARITFIVCYSNVQNTCGYLISIQNTNKIIMPMHTYYCQSPMLLGTMFMTGKIFNNPQANVL